MPVEAVIPAQEGISGAAVPVKALILARGDDTSNSGLVDPSLRSGCQAALRMTAGLVERIATT